MPDSLDLASTKFHARIGPPVTDDSPSSLARVSVALAAPRAPKLMTLMDIKRNGGLIITTYRVIFFRRSSTTRGYGGYIEAVP